MSMYAEQDLYKFLERIAVALERLAVAPVTGYPQIPGSLNQNLQQNLHAPSAVTPLPLKTPKAVVGTHSIPAPKVETTTATPAVPTKPPTDKLQ